MVTVTSGSKRSTNYTIMEKGQTEETRLTLHELAMRRKTELLHFVLQVLLLASKCRTAVVSEYDALYTDIFTDYNKKLPPVVYFHDVTYVEITTELISVNEFNGITGELSLTVLFFVTWIEQRMSWDPTSYNNVTSFIVSPEDMWRPQIFIRQSADRVVDICKTSLMMRLYYDGTVFWTPGAIVKITCSMDVTRFPFDKQLCGMTLSSYGKNTETVVYAPTETLGTTYFMTNSQWELDKTSDIKNLTSNNSNSIAISIVLQRRSTFFVVYIVIPIISLGLLNTLVFVMPATSGERTSVAITTFLSFVVYMQLINDVVPENSEPMAYIFYYLSFLMIYSSVSMLLCIVSLRIYERSDSVPKTLRQIIWYLTFRCIREQTPGKICPRLDNKSRTSLSVQTIDEIDYSEKQEIKKTTTDENENFHTSNMDDITWKTVGKTFDRYCYVILNVVFIIVTAVTFSIIQDNT